MEEKKIHGESEHVTILDDAAFPTNVEVIPSSLDALKPEDLMGPNLGGDYFSAEDIEEIEWTHSALDSLNGLTHPERVDLANRISTALENAPEEADRNEILKNVIDNNVVFADSPEASILTWSDNTDSTLMGPMNQTLGSLHTRNEMLRKPGRPVDSKTFVEAQACVDRLYSALRTRPELLGVAAQQVGHDLNMFLVRINNEELLVVNPRIQKYSPTKAKNKGVFYESCPSLPGKQFKTVRCTVIKLFYQDQYGKHTERRFKDSNAVVIQHAYDHIRGVLVSDIGTEVDTTTERIVEL